MVAPSELPSAKTQSQIANYKVLDRDGKELLFHDIVNGPDTPDRTIVIFVRHYYCGSCQQYLQQLTAAITPDVLAQAPTPTSIVVIGCGKPDLIPYYAAETNCSWPMYCDPKLQLYNALGMVKSWDVGTQPAYISKTLPRLAIEGMYQELSSIFRGKFLRAGPGKQQGGEFLFERVETGSEKRITWCHRMQRSWGHAELPIMLDVINGRPVNQDVLRQTDEVSDSSGSLLLANLVAVTGVAVASFALYKVILAKW